MGLNDCNPIIVINDEPGHPIAFRMNKPTNGVVTLHQSEALSNINGICYTLCPPSVLLEFCFER